jgi:voltage-gated potassium channel
MLRKRERTMRWYRRVLEARRRTYALLEHGPASDQASLAADRFLVFLIVVNLAVVILESVPSLAVRYRLAFTAVELVSLVVFSIEYFLRVWTAPEHALYRKLPRIKARWKFMTSPGGLIDLLAVLPFWFAFAVPEDLRVILVFRIVRFLKLARYSPGMRSLTDALYAERRALLGCLVIFCGATLFAAALMHLAERHVQPDKLGTMPDAIWWAVVTLGTIGYGDVVPVTVVGKMIAGVTILTAIVMIALPVGIIATAFAEEIHRRDFVVTWGMVARVPLFAELDAAEIAGIMRLLRAQVVEPGAVIVRRGDQAHSMYFIARGTVEIDLKDRRVTLTSGHFFGEIAVLRRARRTATVTAITRVNLLVLDSVDLHRLMENDPRLAESIYAVVRERVGADIITRKGDMVTEEIAQGTEQPPG